MKTTNESASHAGNGLEQLLHLISLPESSNQTEAGIFKGKVVSAKTGARVFGCVVELVIVRYGFSQEKYGRRRRLGWVPDGGGHIRRKT